jgi:hypothetical protein
MLESAEGRAESTETALGEMGARQEQRQRHGVRRVVAIANSMYRVGLAQLTPSHTPPSVKPPLAGSQNCGAQYSMTVSGVSCLTTRCSHDT